MALSDKRPVGVTTPLGEDVLLFRSMHAEETLGRLSRFELELLSKDEAVDLSKLLGEVMTVRVTLRDGATRYFNGHVARCAYAGRSGHYVSYRVTLQPWLWFLQKRSNCRIFHEKTVLDILKAVCGDHGFSAIDDSNLSGKPEPREYTVQYRESDFDFVSRLLEDEGIYYYFEHTDGAHDLVLCDAPSSHDPTPHYEEIPFYAPVDKEPADRDHIEWWSVSSGVVSQGYGLGDFNFETPTVDLTVKKEDPHPGSPKASEVFDYPGIYAEKSPGEVIAERRLQEVQADYEIVDAVSNARGVTVGKTFELSGSTRPDQNRKYMVRSVTHDVAVDGYESGAEGGQSLYQNRFQAIEASVQHRPPRLTPVPRVSGPQTAIVIGSGDIDVDEFGRVLVKFHWDREPQDSRRVRVSHNWAGSNWGGIFMPHVGHEVIVDFLEGDPDQPVVTGRVYNQDNMPPNSLPADKTKAIIRDMAGNEFIMESKSGSEMIELRDKFGNEMVMDAVEGTIKIFSPSHNSEFALGRSIQLFTDSNMSTDVKGNQETQVTGNQQAKVGGARIEEIIGKHDVKVGADMLQVYGGMKHDTTVGLVSGFTGGTKTEVFVGAELAIKKARSAEIISGSKYTKGAQKALTKYPTFKDDVDSMKQFYKDQKTKVTDKMTEASGKIQAKCSELKTKADKIKEDASSRFTKCSGELKEKAASWKSEISGKVSRKAAMIEEKANMWKQKASQIFLG